MKKFVLNLITVLAWVYQVILWIGIGAFTASVIMSFIWKDMPDFRKGFIIGISGGKLQSISDSQYNQLLTFILGISIVIVIGSIIQILICRYVKKIIKNIKAEIYFASETLFWLKRLLIVVASYVVVSAVGYCISRVTFSRFPFLNSNVNVQNIIYPNTIISGIMFLVVFYVVYIVFKYGLKLQQESDEII